VDELIEFIKDMIKYIIIIAIIVLIRIYVLTTTEVVGASMEPDLKDGDILLVEQLTNRYGEYERFDIIVFEQSPSYLIKRIVGLPGETIQYIDNELYINDKVIDFEFKTNGKTEDFGPYVVPDGSYYVLGDNRINSVDSRVFGFVLEERIIGRPFLGMWPFNKIRVVN